MPNKPEHSSSTVLDKGDNELSEAAEAAESTTREAGPSRQSEDAKASSSRKGKGEGGPQTRNRRTHVCSECKRAKQGCDLTAPSCARCTEKGLKCVYPLEDAQNKPVQLSTEDRLENMEVFIGLLVEGVTPVPWTGSPASNEEVKRCKAEHVAAGRILHPNPLFVSNARPPVLQDQGLAELDTPMITNGPSALLSCVGDSAHGYLHLICQSEGLQDDLFCGCDDRTRKITHIDVKEEEEERVVVDVNMTPSAAPERQSKQAPKREATRTRPQAPADATAYLPAAKAYYHFRLPLAGPASGLSFYAKPPDVRAYSGTNAPPTSSSSAPTSTPPSQSLSRPSVTQELVSCIPVMSKCLEYLDRAQDILTESPVEMGQWSRAAAWPQALRDKLVSEVNKTSGWSMVKKRVKQLWGRQRQSRPSLRHNAAASGPSPSPIPPSGLADSRVVAVPPTHPINESLPFFALACTLFAFGADPARDSDPSNTESGPYLLALGQQALSIWIDGGEHLPTRNTEIVVPDEMVKEARADYFRAHSLAVQYYLVRANRSAQADAAKFMTFRHPNKRQLLNLMSKMSTQLAAWDYEEGLVLVDNEERTPRLATDASAYNQIIRKIGLAEAEEARRRLFWQIVFYERNIASMFGRKPLIPDSRYSATALPTLVPDYGGIAADILKLAGVPNPELEIGAPAEQSGPSGQAPSIKEGREVEEERLRIERMFFGLRARITQLVSTVERRTAARRYSSEDAARLITEVQALLASAPAELRWAWRHAIAGTPSAILANGESVPATNRHQGTSAIALSEKAKGKARADDGISKAESARPPSDVDEGRMMNLIGSSQTSELTTAELRTRALSRELALLSHLLIVRTHSPFTSRRGDVESSTLPPCPDALLNACTALICVAKLVPPLGQLSSSLRVAPSTLLAMYPLEQLVFDAVVLCSQHCFGSVIINSKDDRSGVQQGDLGNVELLQTVGHGLDLLEGMYGIPKGAGQASGSSDPNGHSKTPVSLKTKVIAFLRNQWTLKSQYSRGHKRKRSITEYKDVASSAEPQIKKSCPTTERSDLDSSTENKCLPLHTVADDQSGSTSSSPTTRSQASKPTTTTPPDANAASTPGVARFTQQEAMAVSEKNKGRNASSMSRGNISVRARVHKDGTRGGASKRKHVVKPQTPSQEVITTAPNVSKHGRLSCQNDDQAPHATQQPPPAPRTVIMPQPAPGAPQPSVRHSHPPPAYGHYDSKSSSEQQAYAVASSNPSPAGQYDHTYGRAMVTASSVPATPFSEYGGHATYPAPAPGHTSPYYHPHDSTYAPYPPAPTPVSAISEGYLQNQAPDNAGNADQYRYGSSTGMGVYMDKQMPPYTRLSFPPADLSTTSRGSLSNWRGHDHTEGDVGIANTCTPTGQSSNPNDQWS